MPWLNVKATLEESSKDFPTPDLALDVQRGETPGAPGGILLSDINGFIFLLMESRNWYPSLSLNIRVIRSRLFQVSDAQCPSSNGRHGLYRLSFPKLHGHVFYIHR